MGCPPIRVSADSVALATWNAALLNYRRPDNSTKQCGTPFECRYVTVR